MRASSRLIRLALFGVMALPLGCSDGTVEYTNEGVKEDDGLEGAALLDTSTVEYVRSNDELKSRLNAQSELIWAPDRAFSGVVMHISSPGIVELEYATQAADGTRSVFKGIEVSDPENTDFMVHIPLSAPARALVLRLNNGAESISFIRAEFLHEVGLDGHVHSDDDIDVGAIYDGTFKAAVSKPGRYEPSAEAMRRASENPPRRDDAPAWSARTCTAGDYNFSHTTPGAQALAAYIKANFEGVRSIGGFGCRPNSANTSRLSVHGTGRALDVMMPLSNGTADNTLGDKIAEFVITNATEMGVQTVIWDNTIWSSTSPTTHRYYGDKPNVTLRHEDHLHIEINQEAAGNGTPWYKDPSVATLAPSGATGGGALTGSACSSKTLGRQVPAGESVQMNYSSGCGDRCSWATCQGGTWQCAPGPAGTNHPHPSCATERGGPTSSPPPTPAPAPSRSSCFSRTLNTSVGDGVCVQMNYAACGGTCKFAACRDGGWSCTEESNCTGEKKRNSSCGGAASTPTSPAPQGAACSSKTLGMTVPAGSCVQMSYDACGSTCSYATCADGQWVCGGSQSTCSGQAFAHNACGSGGATPRGGGTGPAPGPSKTVDQLARERGCSSSVVNGLSVQLIEELNCIESGLLKSFAGQSTLRLGASAFPYLQTAATDDLIRAAQSRSMGVNSALRTIPQQYLLYRWQGSCGITIAASPGRSNHNGGLAVDTSDYAAMKSTLAGRGWVWFGAGDAVHFTHGGRDIRGLSVLAFQRLWNRNNPNDRIQEDSSYGGQTEDRLKRAPSNGFAQGASCSGARSGTLAVQPGLLVKAFDLDILGPSLELETLVPARAHLIEYLADGVALGHTIRDGEQGAFKLLAKLPEELVGRETVTVESRAFNEEGLLLGVSEVVADLNTGTGLDIQNWGWGGYQLKVATPPPGTYGLGLRAQDGSFIELEYLNPEDVFDISFSLRAHQGQRPTLQFLSEHGEIIGERLLPMTFQM